ncbi:MAG TPA: thioredoxin [Myxococcales bacterium]|jgi:thioredoxin 1|nr:thioredoxin [Myxococcales bacterium]
MATRALTTEQFKPTVESGGILFIDWWAEWCGPCRAFAPIYEKVAEANPDITFAKIDTDKEQQLAAAFGIRSIPTLMIFRDGIPLYAQPGALPQPELEELVRRVRAIDMDEIRREISQRQGADAKEEGAEAPDSKERPA